jgi:hypothetical protein
MSLQVVALAFMTFAGAFPPGRGQGAEDAAGAPGSLVWLGPVSIVAVVAMVLLELGKSLPRDHSFRRLADRATRPLVVLALAVILASGFLLADIIGFIR